MRPVKDRFTAHDCRIAPHQRLEPANAARKLTAGCGDIDDQELVGLYRRRSGFGNDRLEQALTPVGREDGANPIPKLEMQEIGIGKTSARDGYRIPFPPLRTIRLSIAL